MANINQPTNASRVPGRVIHGDFGQIAGRSWWARFVTLVVLGAAAAVDVVTFHQVLLLALDETEEMIWAAVAGFVVVAIALSHHAGFQARQATGARNAPGARLTAWLCVVVWSALGLMAFLFRLVVAEPAGIEGTFVVDGESLAEVPGANDHSQTLSALLFLALYLGTGVISGLAGFLRFEPAAKQYSRAVARRAKLAKRRADSGWVLAGARQINTAIGRERERQEEEWTRTEREYHAIAARLKQDARPLIHSIRRHQQDSTGLAPRDGEDPTPRKET